MYKLICQKPAHFLSGQMALVSTFFQMFIILGMYNFASNMLFAVSSRQPTCAYYLVGKTYTPAIAQNINDKNLKA